MGEEGVEDWAQHTALWYDSVQNEGGGVVVVKPNRLWSVSKKIQDPIAEGGAEISELVDQLGWDDSAEGRAEINE